MICRQLIGHKRMILAREVLRERGRAMEAWLASIVVCKLTTWKFRECNSLKCDTTVYLGSGIPAPFRGIRGATDSHVHALC